MPIAGEGRGAESKTGEGWPVLKDLSEGEMVSHPGASPPPGPALRISGRRRLSPARPGGRRPGLPSGVRHVSERMSHWPGVDEQITDEGSRSDCT